MSRAKPPRPKPVKLARTSRWRDRTGEVIGRLTVTGWSGYLGGRSRWDCVCACGNTVTGVNVWTSRSCGCGHRLAAKARRKLPLFQRPTKIVWRGSILTFRQAMSLFHVKHSTIRSWYCRFPDGVPERLLKARLLARNKKHKPYKRLLGVLYGGKDRRPVGGTEPSEQ